MAMTPTEIDAQPDYTDAQLLKQYRKALLQIASGGSYTIGTRTWTSADGKFLMEMVDWLEDRIQNDDGSSGGGLVLVQYGDRV